MTSHSWTKLDVERIRDGSKDLVIGSDLRYLPSVDSTNRVAAQLAHGTWRTGTVVISDFQTSGRGRRGRGWICPPGAGLLLSVVFRVSEVPVDLSRIGMVGALAVQDAVADITGVPAQLKWPNDVLVRGKKLCGLLAESIAGGDPKIVVGIGINVNCVPGAGGMPNTATSLSAETGHIIEREALAAGLLTRLDLWYRCVTVSPDDIYVAWASRLDIVGKSVQVSDSAGSWPGIVTQVRQDGALVARRDDGEIRTLYAADVSVRS